MIEIKVSNTEARIYGLTDQTVINAISRMLSYTMDGVKFSYAFRSGGWDGTVRLLSKKLSFPAGLAEEVNSAIISYGLPCQTTYTEIQKPITPMSKWEGFELRDYQNKIVDVALQNRRCILKASTGAGKSEVISRIVFEVGHKTIVYVVSLDLLQQMKDGLERALGVPIGQIGNSVMDIDGKDIIVVSVWSAAKAYAKPKEKFEAADEDVAKDNWNPNDVQKNKIRDLVESAELVILDEAHFCPAGSIQSLIKNSKNASRMYGLTATPFRGSGIGGDNILLNAAFGKKACDVSASELIDAGWLVKPRIFFRDIPKSKVKIKKSWPDVKSGYIVNNAVRNEILIGNTLKLLEMKRRPLMLFREIAHGKILADMLPANVNYAMLSGKDTLEYRTEVKKDFKDGKIDIILASTIFDQGVDIKELDALILCSGGRSTGKNYQRIGRVIRGNVGKTNAIVVDTFDNENYTKVHSELRFNSLKLEPSFEVDIGPEFKKYLKIL